MPGRVVDSRSQRAQGPRPTEWVCGVEPVLADGEVQMQMRDVYVVDGLTIVRSNGKMRMG